MFDTLKTVPRLYFFTPNISASTGISKFWFELNNDDGSGTKLFDNGGSGFVLGENRTRLMFDNVRSGTVPPFDVVQTMLVAAVSLLSFCDFLF
jgi:hypothetical protein